jgi:Family of unknown function (DUF6289)
VVRKLMSTVVLVGALATTPVLLATPAQSIPACKVGYQCSRTYYESSTSDVVVGGFTRFCDGTTDSWGTTTPYQVTTQSPCGNS